MKCTDTLKVRIVLLTCIVGVVLGSLCLVWQPYFDSNIQYNFRTSLAGRNGPKKILWNSADYQENGRMLCESELACSLPKGWQAGWCCGTLWIMHYYPNGTVADALPFKDLEGFCQWFETHPDCCDVDVEKTVSEIAEDAI
jgi:hypothetical protein